MAVHQVCVVVDDAFYTPLDLMLSSTRLSMEVLSQGLVCTIKISVITTRSGL